MSTPLKFLLVTFGAIVALLIAIAAAVALLVEPEDFRPYLVTAVGDATGRTFELEGELGLELLPCCSVTVGRARLGNPPDFPSDEFARLESATLSLALWPLLSRREVRLGTVTLDGLDLTLTRLADGRANWQFDDATPADAAPERGPAPEPAPPPELAGIDIEAVAVRDGRLRFEDLGSGDAYRIDDLSIDSGKITRSAGAGLAVPVQATMTLTDETRGTSARVGLESHLTMTDARLLAAAPELRIEATGEALPGGRIDVAVTAKALEASLGDTTEVSVEALGIDVRALDSHAVVTANGRFGAQNDALAGAFTLDETSPRRLAAALAPDVALPEDPSALGRLAANAAWRYTGDAVAVTDLDVRLDDSRLTGTIDAGPLDAPFTKFDLTLDALDLDRYATTPASTTGSAPAAGEPTVAPLAALAGLDTEGRVAVGRLRAAGVSLDDVRVSLSARRGRVAASIDADAGGGGFSLTGNGTVSGATPALAGKLEVRPLSPRALLTALGTAVETRDADALERLAGNAEWRLTERALAFESMRWVLDGTTLTGNLGIDDFDAPTTRFDITLDRLDLDAYLPPETEQAEAAEAGASGAEIPAAAIRDLRVDGRLRAGQLQMLGMSLTDVLAEVHAQGGVLRLDPLSAKLYGGDYRGRIAVDATGPATNVSLEQTLEAVQVREVLATFFDTDLLEGALTFRLTGQGSGNSTTDLLQQLAGDVAFDLRDGVYRGTDLTWEFARARALFKNEPPPAEPAERVTPIRALSAVGKVAGGVLETNAFTLETEALKVLGTGGIDLVDLALDYRLDAQVLSTGSDRGLRDLANATIPFTLTGPLDAPKVGIDLRSMVATTLRDTAQQKVRDALLKRLGGNETPGTAPAPSAEVPPAPASEPGAAAATAPTAEAAPTTESPAPAAEPAKPKAKDLLKQGLRELLKPKPVEDEVKSEQDPSSG